MMPTLTIARREIASLFFSPIAYVMLFLFSLGASLIFFINFDSNLPASLRGTFEPLAWLMGFLIPAISMRLLSEEFRSGTIESMMTSPLTDTQMVLGKWLGAMGFFIALLALPTLFMLGAMEYYARPDYGPIVTGLLGLVLVGGLYLAIGTLASATTQNQIIAFMLSVFIICLFTLLTGYLSGSAFLGARAKEALFYLNINLQFEEFSKGIVDLSNLVYFLSGIAFFLFLAVKLLESRRWR